MRLRRVAGCGALYGPRSRPRHPNPIPSHLDANPILLGVPSSLVRAPYSHMRVAIPSHIDIESPPRYSNMLQKRGGSRGKNVTKRGGSRNIQSTVAFIQPKPKKHNGFMTIY